MRVFTVTLSIPDLHSESPSHAAFDFLAALHSADWTLGLVFTVSDGEAVESVRLDVENVERALTGQPMRKESDNG